MQDAYRAALTGIHDDAFGFIAEGAGRMLVAGLELNRIERGLVVELACGGGISSQIINDAGYDVFGCDSSESMIELARRRVPRGEFSVSSLYDVEIPPCVAVTAIGEAFNYRFDERAGLEAMREVLERAHVAMQPGGVLLLDVALRVSGLPRMEHMMWEGPGWRVTSEVVEDSANGRLEREIVTHTGVGLQERDVEHHSLVLYDHEEVFELLRTTGFDPATLAAYSGDYKFSAHHGGFYAVCS